MSLGSSLGRHITSLAALHTAESSLQATSRHSSCSHGSLDHALHLHAVSLPAQSRRKFPSIAASARFLFSAPLRAMPCSHPCPSSPTPPGPFLLWSAPGMLLIPFRHLHHDRVHYAGSPAFLFPSDTPYREASLSVVFSFRLSHVFAGRARGPGRSYCP